MASTQTSPAPAAAIRRDRPYLLPSNRRLRNLVSISLRNLSLAPPRPARPRGRTIDDDAAPHALRSPAKRVALREQKQALGHSRSSSDLTSIATTVPAGGKQHAAVWTNGNGSTGSDGSPRTPPRPAHARARRTSTLEWATATPQRRQEKLELVARERTADVFFSMHVEGVEEPVYVSEVVERTMNPTLRRVDWSACGPGITRQDSLTLRFWVRTARVDGWRQLLELSLCLRGLQYLGSSLDQFHHSLPPNTVIFHLSDGVYTSFQSLSDYAPPPAAPLARAASSRVLPTSSFDALLRLSKLDDSIQDALATRNQIATALETLLHAHRDALGERDRVAEAADRLKTIDYAQKTVERQLEKARRQQDEKRQVLAHRRHLMRHDLEHREAQRELMQLARPALPGRRDEHSVHANAIQNQRRRICEDLQRIFPLHPVVGKPLAFTIRDLALPNSDDLDAESPERVAAALGHVAHVVLALSFYLTQPLPYPVTPRSSASTIEDRVSLLKAGASATAHRHDDAHLRTYPLFARGVPRFRFEYGVFLLNKDIQILLEQAYGVRVLDIRQTLPNLKYLLYVATAGEGELPARKAGGVRGLVRGAYGGAALSRTASNDSASSALSGLLWHVGANGKPKGAVESLRRNMDARA